MFMVWYDHNHHFCARCVYCSVNHNLVTNLCCSGSSWRKTNSWLMVFNLPWNWLNIKANIRYNSQLCPYDIKHIIFGNFTHLCNFLCTPKKRKCVAQIWDSAFGRFWQKSCGKVSRWLVGRVTEPPFLLCLPLLTIIFLIIFRLIYNMLSCLVNCNPYFIFLSQRLSFSFSSVLFLHIILSNKL